MLGSPSCPPLLNVDRDNKGCHIIMDKILRYISSNSNIKNVIITGRFAATESGTQFYKETEKNFYSLSLKTNKLIILNVNKNTELRAASVNIKSVRLNDSPSVKLIFRRRIIKFGRRSGSAKSRNGYR